MISGKKATLDSFLRRHGNGHHQQDQEQKVVPEGLEGQEASEETQRLLFVEEAGTFSELVVVTLRVHDDPCRNFLTLKESRRSLLVDLPGE